MDIEAVVGVLQKLAQSSEALDASALAACLGSSGWEPAGTPVQEVPRKWSRDVLQASIYSEGNEDFLEFAFRVIPPDWDLPEYSNAVDTEYASEIEHVREIAERITALLAAGDVLANAVSAEDHEVDVDFIEKFSWAINGHFLTAGVVHPDEDAPILLLARVRGA
jgi:hypothetical protein